MAKLTGISPLHGLHAAIPIACDALNARAVAVQEYHYHDREVMAVTYPKDTYGSLKIIARFTLSAKSWRISPLAHSLSKCIRSLFIQLSKNIGLSAYQNKPKIVCFDRMTNY